MKPPLASALALLLSAPAAAQFTTCNSSGPFVNCFGGDGTMTNCDRTGPIVNCNTVGGTSVAPPPQTYAGNGVALGNGIVALVRSMNERRARAQVAKALDEGNCEEAARLAIRSNSISLGRLVLAACPAR